jgi:general secretion pathway protein G
MLQNRNTNRSAFTLVEILIVVIILGILAAIVIPRFSGAADESRKASLASQLNAIRGQIQLFTIEHDDTRPALTGSDWTPLTTITVHDGRNRGPYLPNVPRNPLNGFSDIAVVVADPAFGGAVTGSNIGYVYNSTNGFMWGTTRSGTRVFNEANLNDPVNSN